ncbi:MAG: YggT family protein [Sporolactobacillus sp.]
MYLAAYIIAKAISIYSWILLIYVLMSWVPSVLNSQIGYLFARVCEPYLSPFRRFIPPLGGVLDLSPVIAFLVLQFASRGITYIFLMFG